MKVQEYERDGLFLLVEGVLKQCRDRGQVGRRCGRCGARSVCPGVAVRRDAA